MRIEERGEELVVVDFDEFEAYRISCKIEKEGIKFYRKLAEKTKNAEAKELLEFMIEEEKKHLRFFDDCLYGLRVNKEETSEDNDFITSADFAIFQPYQSIPELEDIVSDFRKALRLGISIEDKSIKFYEACRQRILAVDTQAEIGNIISEEKRHKDLLESIAANLSDKAPKK